MESLSVIIYTSYRPNCKLSHKSKKIVRLFAHRVVVMKKINVLTKQTRLGLQQCPLLTVTLFDGVTIQTLNLEKYFTK